MCMYIIQLLFIKITLAFAFALCTTIAIGHLYRNTVKLMKNPGVGLLESSTVPHKKESETRTGCSETHFHFFADYETSIYL